MKSAIDFCRIFFEINEILFRLITIKIIIILANIKINIK